MMEKNNFRSICQCCGRTVKGNENKYRISCDNFSVKLLYGVFKREEDYVLCMECYRGVKLFIKKGGILK